ncbi:hypothetical protein EDB80DRAFT_673953 [Ilyonectria destructans]|nr:hypothetical protein EDB80DRAFT_673953 [Ilyonectria destructans]
MDPSYSSSSGFGSAGKASGSRRGGPVMETDPKTCPKCHSVFWDANSNVYCVPCRTAQEKGRKTTDTAVCSRCFRATPDSALSCLHCYPSTHPAGVARGLSSEQYHPPFEFTPTSTPQTTGKRRSSRGYGAIPPGYTSTLVLQKPSGKSSSRGNGTIPPGYMSTLALPKTAGESSCLLCGRKLTSDTYAFCSNCTLTHTSETAPRMCIMCGRGVVLDTYDFCADCALGSNESEQVGDTGTAHRSLTDSYLMPPPPLPPHVSRARNRGPRPTPSSPALSNTSLPFGTSDLSRMPPPPLPPHVDTSASPDPMPTLNSPSFTNTALPSGTYGSPSSALPHGTSSSYGSSDTVTPYGTNGLYGSSSTALPYGSSSSAFPYGRPDPHASYNTALPHGTSSSFGASGSALPYGTSGSYGTSSAAPYDTLSSGARSSGLTDLEIAYILSSTSD